MEPPLNLLGLFALFLAQSLLVWIHHFSRRSCTSAVLPWDVTPADWAIILTASSTVFAVAAFVFLRYRHRLPLRGWIGGALCGAVFFATFCTFTCLTLTLSPEVCRSTQLYFLLMQWAAVTAGLVVMFVGTAIYLFKQLPRGYVAPLHATLLN